MQKKTMAVLTESELREELINFYSESKKDAMTGLITDGKRHDQDLFLLIEAGGLMKMDVGDLIHYAKGWVENMMAKESVNGIVLLATNNRQYVLGKIS